MPNYGDAADLVNLQASAPMASSPQQTATPAPAMGGQPQQQAPQAIPLTEPSQRPNEPVTAGAARGPGPGPEILSGTPEAQTQGFQNALSLLNQLGDGASTQVKAIRNALAAHLNNQAGQ
jgi:hypothetical protein